MPTMDGNVICHYCSVASKRADCMREGQINFGGRMLKVAPSAALLRKLSSDELTCATCIELLEIIESALGKLNMRRKVAVGGCIEEGMDPYSKGTLQSTNGIINQSNFYDAFNPQPSTLSFVIDAIKRKIKREICIDVDVPSEKRRELKVCENIFGDGTPDYLDNNPEELDNLHKEVPVPLIKIEASDDEFIDEFKLKKPKLKPTVPPKKKLRNFNLKKKTSSVPVKNLRQIKASNDFDVPNLNDIPSEESTEIEIYENISDDSTPDETFEKLNYNCNNDANELETIDYNPSKFIKENTKLENLDSSGEGLDDLHNEENTVPLIKLEPLDDKFGNKLKLKKQRLNPTVPSQRKLRNLNLKKKTSNVSKVNLRRIKATGVEISKDTQQSKNESADRYQTYGKITTECDDYDTNSSDKGENDLVNQENKATKDANKLKIINSNLTKKVGHSISFQVTQDQRAVGDGSKSAPYMYKADFNCSHCNLILTTKRQWITHLREVHDITRWTCQSCGITFKSRPKLKKHMQDQHPELADQPKENRKIHRTFVEETPYQIQFDDDGSFKIDQKKYQCRICESKFQSMEELNEHKRDIHVQKENLTCTLCFKRFKELNNLQTHHRYCHQTSTKRQNRKPQTGTDGICEICGQYYERVDTHIKTKHNSNTVKCKVCGIDVHRDAYTTHLKGVHLGVARTKKYYCTCPYCNKTYDAGSIKAHIDSVHRKIKHECPICSNKFSNREIMKQHIQNIHEGIKKYQCKFCPKKFSCGGNRNKHYKTTHQKEMNADDSIDHVRNKI